MIQTSEYNLKTTLLKDKFIFLFETEFRFIIMMCIEIIVKYKIVQYIDKN